MKDKILVNDIIKIKHSENIDSYSFYDSWFESYGISTDNQYGTPLSKHAKSFDESYECIWAAPNHTTGVQLYAIEGIYSHKIFLIDSHSIKRYYHTCRSYDNTEDALRLISKQYRKVLVELDEAHKEIDRLTPKIDVPAKEFMPKNPMPPLEDGMFGVIEADSFDCECKFRVMNGIIFIDNGVIFYVEDFKGTNKHCGLTITELYNDVEDFDDYENGTRIWSI